MAPPYLCMIFAILLFTCFHGASNTALFERISAVELKQLEFQKKTEEKFDKVFEYISDHAESEQKNSMISITEANQNFSKVTRLVDERGTAVILKNNVPRYLVIDFSKADENAIASDEDVLAISKRLLAQNKEAYEVLANL